MPKLINDNYDQMKMLAVSYDKQILSGTFESSLMYLIDQKLDLTIFHGYYKNDDNGRPAYDPAILLRIVLRTPVASPAVVRLNGYAGKICYSWPSPRTVSRTSPSRRVCFIIKERDRPAISASALDLRRGRINTT